MSSTPHGAASPRNNEPDPATAWTEGRRPAGDRQRHDLQHDDLQHDDPQHGDLQHDDLQHDDPQHGDLHVDSDPHADDRDPEAVLPDEAELEARARRLFELWGVADRLAHVEVLWNRRLRTSAGRAHLRTIQVHLNPRLLARVPGRVDEVLAHECAHLATALEHPRARHHGPEWADLMRCAGFAPNRTHDFPVAGLRPRRSYFLHLCERCGDRRILDDDRAPPACGCEPGRVRVYRAPRNARGRRALERFRAAPRAGRRGRC